MENLNSKAQYLNRKSKQLKQWDRVIDKMNQRAERENEKNRNIIYQHIKNIQIQKTRTQGILEQLQIAANERWHISKINFEKSWMSLRNAFLKASQSMNE